MRYSTLTRKFLITFIVSIIICAAVEGNDKIIQLPSPKFDSDFSLEEAIHSRRSVRFYSADSLTLNDLSQLLWSCQGITSPQGYRSAPSAGALYPLEIYFVAGRVNNLKQGLYHYLPGNTTGNHSIELVNPDVTLEDVAKAALGQSCIKNATCCFIITGVVERTRKKYGSRAKQYVLIEAGHAGQNICLQAQSLELGVTTVGAFHDKPVKKLLEVDNLPIYLISVGVPRNSGR